MVKILRKALMARVTRISLAVFLTYWVIYFLVPSRVLIEALDGVLFCVSILVLIIYFPITSNELFQNRLDRTGRLLMGITLAWSAMLLLRGLAMWGRTFGLTTPLIETPLFGLTLWALAWSGALHISAPFADNLDFRMPYKRWAFIILTLGLMIATFLLGVQAGLWLRPSPFNG